MGKYGYTGVTPTQSNGSNTGIFQVNEVVNLLKETKFSKPSAPVEYLVIAGGGGGGYSRGGGGGAGGYRSSYQSDTYSGGNSTVESVYNAWLDTPLTVIVGNGGAGSTGSGTAEEGSGSTGEDSQFDTIISKGGGGGAVGLSSLLYGVITNGKDGGSGGGGSGYPTVGLGGTSLTPPTQGFDGGAGYSAGESYSGGSGGGAGGAGSTTGPGGATGGAGLTSSITGSPVTRGGGGGAGNYAPFGAYGPGGSGGGGNGGENGVVNPAAGSPNTGGGGGGGGNAQLGAAGGSGVVIVRYSNAYTATSTGLTTTGEQTDGTDKYIIFTGGTGTITITEV